MSVPNYPNPLQVPDSDPGDETQRNFRYQHACGVFLLLAGQAGIMPYKTIVCEHHEDLLCERNDGKYDAWQIKTRQREKGYWQLNHEPLRKSIKRLAWLVGKFGPHINRVYFASNSASLVTKAKAKLHLSPQGLCKAVRRVDSHTKLGSPFDGSFADLLEYCGCSPDVLFSTLNRMEVRKGPSRDEYEATLSHTYVGRLSQCKTLSPAELNGVRDELISVVHRASSLSRDTASFDWIVDATANGIPPDVEAKRVRVSVVDEAVNNYNSTPFRYLEGTSTHILAPSSSLETLRCKLERGGLASQVLTMGRRVLSTEEQLIEGWHADPDSFDPTLDQLVGVVQGVCDEAHLEAEIATAGNELFGRKKMLLVQQRLKQMAENNPAHVDNQPYEVLIGVSGVLTNECSVWWSEPFDLSDCT